MPDGERCRRAVCERTARTVRKGAAGQADAHGEAEPSTGRETARTEPGRLPANDQPAAYLTWALRSLWGGSGERSSSAVTAWFEVNDRR
jgi:hypothetical protein